MLRSMQELKDYTIGATDGEIGHVSDFFFDDGSWVIRYLVVETSNWWGGHQVLISPHWIEAISWADSTVSVNLNRHAVKSSPRFDSTAELNRQNEMDLFTHYEQPAYWDSEPKPAAEITHDKFNL